MRQFMDLRNKVVVVTGAASGLGKALATEFCKQGCHLALIDIDFEGLQKLTNEFETNDQKITTHQADVSNEESIMATRLNILDQHLHIDILVNNVGISISQYFDQVSIADFKKLFDCNFWGIVYCTKYFLPDLTTRDDSRIVNISSDFALMGFPGKSAYCSSKSAVLGFTNVLMTELCNTTTKVCYVVPPPLDTGLVKNSKHIDEKKREIESNFLKQNGLPLDKVAKRIVKQIRKGKYRIVIGTMMFWIDLLSRLFPTLLHKVIGANKKRFRFI